MNCGSCNLMAILAIPLGWLMWLCNAVLPIYALALLLFTIITRIILFPMSIKQHKSMAKMGALKPKVDALQKQYANNKEKLQEEQMKLYEQAKYNPLSGCLPSVIQMVFLFGLISVIYNPLQHILQMPDATIAALKEKAITVSETLDDNRASTIGTYDMYVITYISKAEDAVQKGLIETNPFTEYDDVVTEKVMAKIKGFDMNLFGYFLGDTIDVPWPTNSETVRTDSSSSSSGESSASSSDASSESSASSQAAESEPVVLSEKYDPTHNTTTKVVLKSDGKEYNVVEKGWTWSWMLLLPLISGITSFLTSFISQKMNSAGEAATQGGGMKAMLYLMPLFSVWIGFTVPSGVVLYWVYSNIAMIAQIFIQYKLWNPQKLADEFAAEMAEKEKSKKRKPATVKVQTVNEAGETVVQEQTLTQREADRIRLAEARKRDAEKYGDEYVEVTDDDLK